MTTPPAPTAVDGGAASRGPAGGAIAPQRWRPWFAVVAACWFVLIAIAALFFSDRGAPWLPGDGHPLAHATVFALCVIAVRLVRPTTPLAPLVACLLVVGVGIEIGQAITGGDAEFGDLIADAIGIALGLVVVAGVRRGVVPERPLAVGVVALMAVFVVVIPTLPDTSYQGELDCVELAPGVTQPGTESPILTVVGDAVVDGSVEQVVEAVAATDAVTLRVRFRAARLDQTGPARLVTISNGVDPDVVNVHLGIQRTGISARIRTDCHLREWLVVDDVINDTDVHEAALVYVPGRLEVWVDGVLADVDEVAAGGLRNWSWYYPLTVGDEATGGRRLDGEVVAAAIYDRALTADELATPLDPDALASR